MIDIIGATNLCSLSGQITNPNYSLAITPPVAGFPGQPPYAVKWSWSPDGIFNPGTSLGSGTSISVGLLACPSFYLRATVRSSDSYTYTETRKISTAFCKTCKEYRSSGSPVVENTSDGDAVKVFPNPTDGTLWIEFSDEMLPQMLELFDLGGQKLQHIMTNIQLDDPTRIKMDLSDLPAGVYLLRVKGNGRTTFHKVIVQPTK